MILRWWFRLAFWARRGWRVPVEALEPWIGDARSVERRLLIARVALGIAEDLRVYPPEIAIDVLRSAVDLIFTDPTPRDVAPPGPRVWGPTTSPIMHVWWALVMLGVTLALLAVATAGRAAEGLFVE